jgi:hypothetical protein
MNATATQTENPFEFGEIAYHKALKALTSRTPDKNQFAFGVVASAMNQGVPTETGELSRKLDAMARNPGGVDPEIRQYGVGGFVPVVPLLGGGAVMAKTVSINFAERLTTVSAPVVEESSYKYKH